MESGRGQRKPGKRKASAVDGGGAAAETRRQLTRRGFACQLCGGRMAVRTTRQPISGLIVRYRRCLAGCDFYLVTEERQKPTKKHHTPTV